MLRCDPNPNPDTRQERLDAAAEQMGKRFGEKGRYRGRRPGDKS